MPTIDTQVGPARSQANNGSSKSSREGFTFTIPEAPGFFSSLRENFREWRRTKIPAEYARAGTVLPVTEMRPWYRDFGSQIKSTRLNSSHMSISYAVFCLKKKKITSVSSRREP